MAVVDVDVDVELELELEELVTVVVVVVLVVVDVDVEVLVVVVVVAKRFLFICENIFYICYILNSTTHVGLSFLTLAQLYLTYFRNLAGTDTQHYGPLYTPLGRIPRNCRVSTVRNTT